jgi:hypothetical protein
MHIKKETEILIAKFKDSLNSFVENFVRIISDSTWRCYWKMNTTFLRDVEVNKMFQTGWN